MIERREFVEDWTFFNQALIQRARHAGDETETSVVTTLVRHQIRTEQHGVGANDDKAFDAAPDAVTDALPDAVSDSVPFASGSIEPPKGLSAGVRINGQWKDMSIPRQTSATSANAGPDASQSHASDTHAFGQTPNAGAGPSTSPWQAQPSAPSSAAPLHGEANRGAGGGLPPNHAQTASMGPSVPPGAPPQRSAPIGNNISWQSSTPSFARGLNGGLGVLLGLVRWLFALACVLVLVFVIASLFNALVGSIPQLFESTHVSNTAIPAALPAPPVVEPTTTSSGVPVVTDYTTFHTVELGNNKVVTGWKFDHSGDLNPRSQYCYLDVANAGGNRSYTIEDRPGGMKEKPDVLIPGLDEAAWKKFGAQCVWHG